MRKPSFTISLLLVILRKDDAAAAGVSRLHQDFGRGGTPARIMRGRLVGLEGVLVAVDLVEEELVRVGVILEHVEAHATRLVAYRARRILQRSGEEFLAHLRLYLERNHYGEHRLS